MPGFEFDKDSIALLREALERLEQGFSQLPAVASTGASYDPANLRRCRSCGALVYLWPCLNCALEAGTATSSNQGVTCHVQP